MSGYDTHLLIVGFSFLAVIVIAIVVLLCLEAFLMMCCHKTTEETSDLVGDSKSHAVTTSFLIGHHGITGSSHSFVHHGSQISSREDSRVPRSGACNGINDMPRYGAILDCAQTQAAISTAPPLYAMVMNELHEDISEERNVSLSVRVEMPPPPYPGT